MPSRSPKTSRSRPRIVLFALFLLAVLRLGAIDVNSIPNPTGYVSDLAHVVDESQKAQLEAFCGRVQRELGVQMALVTIDSLDDRPVEDVALQIGRKWGVGDKKENQGILLLLAIKDRKSDIETGRGIDPYLTDGFSGSILRSLRPQLQARDYGGALLAAAHAIAQQVAQGKNIAFSDDGPDITPRQTRPVQQHRSGLPVPLIVFGIFVLLWLFSRGGRRGGGPRSGGGGTGLLTGMLLGGLLNSGGRSGGSWGSGGGFGGSDSGGGGGFGGFGGGDFGGGGANSDW